MTTKAARSAPWPRASAITSARAGRSIIIDRGRIVANGTPEELKQRSDYAGAVSLRVLGVPADTVRVKLSSVPAAKKAAIVQENERCVVVRVYPLNAAAKNGELARNVAEITMKEGWKIEELHTEEGRLDEVFRAITLPEVAKEAK